MADKLTGKMTDFVKYYCDPGSESYNNATKSAIKAGYTPKTANIASDQLLGNIRIKTAITEYKAKIDEKMDISRELLTDKMLDIVNSGTASNSDKTRSASLIADMCGYKRENAPNREKEQARRKCSEEEELLFSEWARKRTQELSQRSERG